MIRSLRMPLIAAVFAITSIAPTSLLAETVRVESKLDVSESIGRISAAVEKAGQNVFSVFDFAKGVGSAGHTIRPTTAIVFGSPKIGGEAFKASQFIGLYVPLKILAYEDESGKVWLAYEDPAAAAERHGISPDHPAIMKMKGAMDKMTKIGAGS